MIKPGRYARKPFLVDAVLVTAGNIEEVAKWCNGEVRVDDSASQRQYIKVRVLRPLNERQTMAFVGDWVLYAGTGYKVYTSKAFAQVFDPVPQDDYDYGETLFDMSPSVVSDELKEILDAMKTAPDSERDSLKERFFEAAKSSGFFGIAAA